MFRYKFILTTVILAALLFIEFVNSSDAVLEINEEGINIIDMYTPPETYTGLSYPYAYVDTDIAYDTVYWYISDPDEPEDLQYVGETLGEGGATRAYYYFDGLGHIKGKKYIVTAKAWHYNIETETSTNDIEKRDFTVFKSISTTEVADGPKRLRNVMGIRN